MGKGSILRWLVVTVFLGVLVGIVGGGVMGGLVGYYVALDRPAVETAQVPPQLAVANQPAQTPAVTNLTVTENSTVIETVKMAEPAVVTVVSTLQSQPGRFGRGSRPNTAEGSGFILDQQGHIVTNSHVIEGASQLDVIFADGSKAAARLVAADSARDIAVLQVGGSVPAALAFGDSKALQLGETVIAIGSPLGSYRGSVTVGVVSGLNRSVTGTNQSGLIQTDAAINHGNSGGPLVNLAGQVVGINTLVVQVTDSGELTQRLGFAIPSSTASAVVQRLIAQGKGQ